jgi:membrane protease subunit HflC
MSPKFTILFTLLAVFLVGLTQSVFIVDQRQQAILLLLGRPDGNESDPDSFIKKPGLHFKLPFVHTVQYFDSRILSVDPPPAQVVISSATSTGAPPAKETSEAKNNVEMSLENVSGEPIIVDTFARYKITDPLQFLKTMRTIEQANNRLENVLNNATRAVLGKTTLRDLLSDKRRAVMRNILQNVNETTKKEQFGIVMVDVRIVRADLTSDLRVSTVRRMISELKERATETRAKGEERALEIRSKADKEREVILAEAQRDSEITRGEGDKEAIQIYAKAFNQDKDFYSFYRSTEAYKKSLANKETTLVINPDNDFFEFFGDID